MRPNKEFLEDMPGLGKDVEMPQDVVSHPVPGGVLAFRAQLHEESRGQATAAREKVLAMKVGLHTVEGFKAALIVRCGSLLGAWREALDLDGNGRITFGEFCLAMHRLGFHGDVKGLWKNLDSKGQGGILFRDLDPETEAGLSELQAKFEKAHGNMLMAWLTALDVKGTGIVNEQQFVRACNKISFSGDPKKMFRVMQPDITRKFITLKDFDTKAYLALNRGDFRMLSEQPDEARKTAMQKTFMQRQEGGWFFQIRKAWEASRREEFAKACGMDKLYDFIIDTPMEFEELCIRRFGSMLGAWRQVIDWDSNGRITFNEFVNALRRLGYAGSFRGLWKQYDKDGNGHISLKELDPEMDNMVNSLLNLLTDRYGTIDNAWRVGFGKDPHDSCDFRELNEACDVLGYPYDVQKLFKALQPMPGRALLTIWDIDPSCNRKRQRGDVRIVSEPKSPTWQGSSSRRRFGEADVPPEGVQDGAPEAATEDDSLEVPRHEATTYGEAQSSSEPRRKVKSSTEQQLKGSADLHNLRLCLRNKYGSTVAAWRGTLDPLMQGAVSFGKFVLVLEDCAFAGNVKALWEELTLGKSGVTLKDIDPDACRLLDKLREQLLSKCGSLLKAWEALDIDAMGRLDEEEFTKACGRLGLDLKNPKKAFQILRARHGQRSLAVEDLQPLLITVPSGDRVALWAGGNDVQESQSVKEDAEPAVTLPWSPKSGPMSPRAHVEKVSKAHHGQDFKIATLNGFKRMLMNKYGSLFSAWRHCLDADQNGVVTQSDFASACRFLGVKNVQQLWSELDVNSDGQISLQEMDPEAAALFGRLETTLLERYGSTREGWKKVFLHTGCPWCEQDKFIEQCKGLGLEDEAERFYVLVKPEAGRRYLTYEDLWLNLDPNYNRPESPMDWWMRPTSPKEGTSNVAPSQPSSPVRSLMSPKGRQGFTTNQTEEQTR